MLTTLRYFRDEYEAHLQGRCPAGKCTALIKYRVRENCTGCTICAQHCPVDAIPMTPYARHVIDLEHVHALRLLPAGLSVRGGGGRMTPITLTIDGQKVEAVPGQTILQAARTLGLSVPTLCHVEGFEPSASCFLCAVKIEGRPNLWPSCATPAAEGMVVINDSDEVRAARKTSLELLLSDHAGDCVGPCKTGCPAHLDIPNFIERISAGDTQTGHGDRYRRPHPASLAWACLPAAVRGALPTM